MNNVGLYSLYVFGGSFIITLIIYIIMLVSSSRVNKSIGLGVDLFNPFILLLFGFIYMGVAIALSVIIRFTCLTYADGATSIKENVTEIASVTLNSDSSSSLNGSFVLGSGTIKGESEVENYFYFYTKDENGRYKLDKINASTVLIDEDNEKGPNIVVYETYNEVITQPTKFGKLLGFKEETNEHLDDSETETVMYLPEESIIKDYNPNF